MSCCHVSVYTHTRVHGDSYEPGCPEQLTALGDSIGNGQVPVLPVHVMSAAARVISQPDANVLDLGWRFVSNLQVLKPVWSGLIRFETAVTVSRTMPQ